MKLHHLAATALAFSLSGATWADYSITPGNSVTGVTVLGSASIYHVFGHAGDPGGDYGADSPAVLFTFDAGSGNVFTFSATGLVSCCSDTPNIPSDGGGSATSIGGANGLSSISGNSNLPLVGVFTTDTDPYGSAAPGALSFDATNPSSLSPQLQQVFYIGDGLTGKNNPLGTGLTFAAPATATRLYLGIIDAYGFGGTTGYYHDNNGAFSVGVSLAPVPEPETYAMLLAGLGLLGAVVGRRRA